MTRRLLTASVMFPALVALAPAVLAQDAPLTLGSARVSIAGTSNVHDFTASTTDVQLTKCVLASGVGGLSTLLNPGAVAALEVSIKAASLSSPKEGLDKNMHKALKVSAHPDIVFALTKLDGTAGALKAIGLLKIAGVEREVAFLLKAGVTGATVAISGDVPLLMTDYGITPPKAMLGMLKTDPKIVVTFDLVLSVATTY